MFGSTWSSVVTVIGISVSGPCGLTVSEAKRLKSLEDENTKLKKLLADAMLDNAALKELLSKNW